MLRLPAPSPAAACVALLMTATVALAGCATGGVKEDSGTFTLAIADTLAGGRLDLRGAYLHDNATDGWVAALGNSSLAFEATGTNVTANGTVPAGDYDGVRILFAGLEVDGRDAALAQSGVQLALNLTVPADGQLELRFVIAWADALFESAAGLAFDPVLSRLVVLVDGGETLRLDAAAIGGGVAPVARMRIFDATGLEAFASTFVADSPEDPAVANAGELVLSATGSEALAPGASLASYEWDVDGTTLRGITARYTTPIAGGNVTVRLTVTDSEGGSDAQTVRLALKPGRAERSFNFTGVATSSPFGDGPVAHPFGPVNATDLDGSPATLVHITAVLTPGASALPVGDLDFAVNDGAGEEVASGSGSGSQHRIDQDIEGEPASGDWTIEVTPNQDVDSEYTVVVTLTWQGVNPGMEAFLAEYDDGHTHQH